jgi:hypothetical protein
MTAVQQSTANRLSAAHLAAMLIALAGFIYSLLNWTGSELDWFDAPAKIVHYAGLIYLLVTASAEFNTAIILRRTDSIDPRGWPLLAGGHLSVIAIVTVALVRGADSRTLHAGLDVLLATLAVSSGLAFVLALLTWRHAIANKGQPPTRRRGVWLRSMLQAWVCLLAVAALIFLEIRPLPKFDPVSPANPPTLPLIP